MKWLILLMLASINGFSQIDGNRVNYFSAKLDSGYYIINPKGEKVSESFDYLSDMVYGANFIAKRNGKYGVISYAGDSVYPFKYDELYALNRYFVGKTNAGLRVYEKSKRYNFLGIASDVDTSYFFPDIDSIAVMTSEYLIYKIYKKGKEGYSDGKSIVVEPVYDQVWIQNKLLFVKKDGKLGAYQFGSYDQPLIPAKYEYLVNRNDTIYQALINGKYDYFKFNGESIKGINGNEVVFFQDGYKVFIKGKAYVYNYSDCRLKQKGLFDDVFPLSTPGYFAFRRKGRVGVCDTNGKILLNNKYDYVDIQNDQYLVRKDGLYGILDMQGEVIVDLNYAEIIPKLNQKNPYYLVFKNAIKIGVLNDKGEEVLPCEYKQVSVRNGLILAKLDDGINLYNTKGKLIVEKTYELFNYLNNGVVALKNSGTNKKDIYCHSGLVAEGVSSLSFQGRLLKGYDGENMYLNVFDADGNLRAQEVHSQQESAEVEAYTSTQTIGEFESSIMKRLSSSYLQLSQISGVMEIVKRYTSKTIQSSSIKEVRKISGRTYSISWSTSSRSYDWIGSTFQLYGDVYFLNNKAIVKSDNVSQELKSLRGSYYSHRMVLKEDGKLSVDSISSRVSYDFIYLGATGQALTADESEIILGPSKGVQISLNKVFGRINDLGLMLLDEAAIDQLNTDEVLTVTSHSWTIGTVRKNNYYPVQKDIVSVNLLPNQWFKIPVKFKDGKSTIYSFSDNPVNLHISPSIDIENFENTYNSYKVLQDVETFNLVFRDSFLFKNGLSHAEFIGDKYLMNRGSSYYNVYKIDSSGVHKIKEYRRIKRLSNNRYLVSRRDKYSIIDADLKTIIRPTYHKVEMVNDSLFLATRFDLTYLLNHKGKRLTRRGYQRIEVLDELDLVIRVKDGNKRMCLQVSDNMKRLEKVKGKILGEGYYLRVLPTGMTLLKGKDPVPIKGISRVVGKFSSGMLLIHFKDGRYRYFSSKTGDLVDQLYDSALPFQGGFAIVRKDGLKYLINCKGDLIAKDVGSKFYLKGSLALVFSKLTNQFLLYNQAGDLVSNDPRLDIHLEVKYDYFVLNSKGKSSLYDQSGANLGFEQYDEIHIVGYNQFAVREGQIWYLVNSQKKVLLCSGLDQVVAVNGDLYIYKYAPRYGVILGYQGLQNIPAVYRDIEFLNGSVYRGITDEYVHYLVGSDKVLEVPIN